MSNSNSEASNGIGGDIKIDSQGSQASRNSTDELLRERGKQYGSFSKQVETIRSIMNSLWDIRYQGEFRPPSIDEEDIENFFIVLKLVRMQTSDDRDSIDDLIGYATLIRDKRYGS